VSDKGADTGDCEAEDEECIRESKKLLAKPADDSKVMTS